MLLSISKVYPVCVLHHKQNSVNVRNQILCFVLFMKLVFLFQGVSVWPSLHISRNMLMPLGFLRVNVKKSKSRQKLLKFIKKIFISPWTIWWILMKFSEKMSLMTILKITETQGFNLSLENKISGKPRGDPFRLTPRPCLG